MSNLSQSMRDVIMGATDEGLLTVGAPRTVTALKTRGLVFDALPLSLTPAGKAVRAELTAPNQGDVNPPVEQYAEWERELLGDDHIAEYLAQEATETASQNAADETNPRSEGEDTQEAVPGLEKLLDTPRLVPNRKDKRNRRRIVRAFNRLFARKRDEQTKKRTDAAKAARKRGRRVSV